MKGMARMTEATEITAPQRTWSHGSRRKQVLSSFETAPPWLFYLPVAVWWMLLAARYGSTTLPALANTSIRTGGLCGESKAQALGILGPEGRQRTAPFFFLSRHREEPVASTLQRAREGMAQMGVAYPVVAKPDMGRNGRGVMKIEGDAQLAAYLAAYRDPVDILIQEFVPMEGEAGIFYIRYPGEARGHITSVTLKYFPRLTGDGRRTVRELLRDDPRAGKVQEFYLPRLADRLEEVPAPGQTVPLVFTGNHCQGAVFRNGTGIVTPPLTEAFDRIVAEAGGFYFGRFDLRYRDIAALRRGEDFRIIEVNGAGAEATHIWDARTRLIDAYRTLFMQIAAAFRIGAMVRHREGRAPVGPLALLRLYFGELRMMKGYPRA